MKKKDVCPNCKAKSEKMVVNIDSSKIVCLSCNSEYNPVDIFGEDTVLGFADMLDGDKADKFLTNLGYKKFARKRTPKYLFYFAVALFVFMIELLAFLFYIEGKSISHIALTALSGPFIAVQLYQYYKDEKKPKWKKVE